MRAAIVGTGFIANVHANALQAIGVELAAVCSRTREGAEAFGLGNAYAELDDLLEHEPVDVLHICTPNALHATQTRAAIERGIHVVCEKPLAVSPDESRSMLEAAEERGVVHATCYHVRGYPLVEQMRADVENGVVGEVAFVHGRYLCDDVLFPASGWRIDPARSGTSYVVGDLGTHWLDLAEHVTGQHVVAVQAEFRSFATDPLEDYAALLLRLSGGAAGCVVLSAGAAGRKNQLLFECEGAKAGLSWDQELPTEMLLRPAGGPRQIVVKDPATNAEPARGLSRYPAGHGEGYGEAFRNLFANIYTALAGSAHAPFPTFDDGHRGVATVDAAVRSARGGGWVEVEL
jgi:predicted dehydrogenase